MGAARQNDPIQFAKEYWAGDSRDGRVVNGDGYHYYCLSGTGVILEAFEAYETEDGIEVVSPLPEMLNINWYLDLGLDPEVLDQITERDFLRIKNLHK